MNDLITLLLVGFLCILIGMAIGGLVASLQANRGEKKPPVPDAREVVRLWREPKRDALLVEMGGKLRRLPDELNVIEHDHLTRTMEDLQLWLGGPGGGVVSGSQPASSGSHPPAAKPLSPAGLSSWPGTNAARLPDEKEKFKPPSMSPVDVLTRAVSADVPKSVGVEKSIAAQIDEILQAKLENSPLRSRAIRLMELPGKGMVVLVGLEQYEGVDAVPDPEIRNLIHACVAEWESK